MIRHETTYYDNFVMKTFTQYVNDIVDIHEEFDIKGQLVRRTKGDLVEKFEYSRNRLRRYSNNKGDWKRYTYKGDETFILMHDSKDKTIYKTQVIKDMDDVAKIIHRMPKLMRWTTTKIQF